jgi:hypothetical protein
MSLANNGRVQSSASLLITNQYLSVQLFYGARIMDTKTYRPDFVVRELQLVVIAVASILLLL